MSLLKDFYHHLFKKYSLSEVFTPGVVARVNYLNRVDLEQRILQSLQTPGIQIIMYGLSGSGKTTLIRKLLESYGYDSVRIQCSQNQTFEDVILNTFSQLGQFSLAEEVLKHGSRVGASVNAKLTPFSAEISNTSDNAAEQKYSRLLPPRLSPQKLAELFRDTNKIWLIEDFHKLKRDEKQKLADVMKVFVDEANDLSENQICKIVCVGAVNSPRELISLDPNLSTRVEQIKVPLLTDVEIKKIIKQGCYLLNVVMTENLIDNLVSYSNNIGSLAHSMCLDICNSCGVSKTSIKVKYVDDAKFNVAIKGYLDRNSDTLQKSYNMITAKNKAVWYILKSINMHNRESIRYSDLLKRINPTNCRIAVDDIQAALHELQEEPYSIIRHDDDTDSYSFSTPFWSAFIRIQMEEEQAEKNRKKRKYKGALLVNDDSFEAMIYKQILELYKNREQLKIRVVE